MADVKHDDLELLEALPALLRDATRYRWLRNRLAIEDVEQLERDYLGTHDEAESAKCDRAVDAAIAKATHPAPYNTAPESAHVQDDGAKVTDASQLKQPGWNHVQQAFIDGAREALANPDATDADFGRASDGYTKRVFAEVDPAGDRYLNGAAGCGVQEVPRG